MKIAMITAGGAGMFCGSCMQDNTLVRTLRHAGADAVLIPTYTPIRVDEENASSERVFLGGINVYLDSAIPGWRWLPSAVTHWLDRPSIIRFLTTLSSSTNAAHLGQLTIDMLSGIDGPQHREIAELVDYLADQLKPDVVLFSNALLSGVIPHLRKKYSGTILTLLQGDDVFLKDLTSRYQSRAINLLTANCQHVDGILTHSRYYSAFMQKYLQLPSAKFREIPLTVDAGGRSESVAAMLGANSTAEGTRGIQNPNNTTIGYFARICPEKGVHRFLESAGQLVKRFPESRFVVAGYLPGNHRPWFEKKLQAAQAKATDGQIVWRGSPDSRAEKFSVLSTFDLLCVPTEYEEPKGLYVLEAASLGIPALLPDHGAFPERIQTLGEGALFNPASPAALTQAMEFFLAQPKTTVQVADVRSRLIKAVEFCHGMTATAPKIMEVIRAFADQRRETR